MSLEHTQLEGDHLGAEAMRALSSPASKMMAARGLVPIADPKELLALMYQLCLDPDKKLAQVAKKGLAELPPEVVKAGLKDPAQDARVLDFMTRKVKDQANLLELIVLNPGVADETVASIATLGGEEIVDVVATNEERLLRHPEIIYSMYMNESARMSTVDRAVELAVRNDVEVPGLKAWDEIRQAALESAKAKESQPKESEEERAAKDNAFKKAAAVESEQQEPAAEKEKEEEKEKSWRDMSIPEKIRAAMMGNAAMREAAVKDPKVMVAMAALKSPQLKEKEVIKWAGLQALDKRIIAYISSQREWLKTYGMKVTLVNNPKTPLRTAMNLVPHMRDKDLRALSRSRSVPKALQQHAKKLLTARSLGKKA